MAWHIHDHRRPEYPSDLLRNDFGDRSERGVGVVVLRPEGAPDMATAVEAEAALAPALEAKPSHA